jgi:hypothetical protein
LFKQIQAIPALQDAGKELRKVTGNRAILGVCGSKIVVDRRAQDEATKKTAASQDDLLVPNRVAYLIDQVQTARRSPSSGGVPKSVFTSSVSPG